MGNFGEKFGLMLRNLGTKIANNFGTASDTYVPICNGTSGAVNTQLTPKGAMSLTELASVLGVNRAFSVGNSEGPLLVEIASISTSVFGQVDIFCARAGAATFLGYVKVVIGKGAGSGTPILFKALHYKDASNLKLYYKVDGSTYHFYVYYSGTVSYPTFFAFNQGYNTRMMVMEVSSESISSLTEIAIS